MQWFVVKYRKPDGVMTEAEFEAADKSALFKILAEKKISAINIQSGRLGKKKSGRKSVAKGVSQSSSVRLVLSILAVVAVAVAALVVWFVFFRSASESTTGKPIKKISRTVRTPPVKERPQPSTSNVVEQALPVPTPPPVGNVVTARTSSSGIVMRRMDGSIITNRLERPFKREFENTLFVITRPGSMSGALVRTLRQRYSDEQIIQMLREMSVPDPGDSPGVAKAKSDVQALKEGILSAIDDGTSVTEVLEMLGREIRAAGQLRAQAMEVRREALSSEDEDLARANLNAANDILEQNGLRPVHVPMDLRKEEVELPSVIDRNCSDGSVEPVE
jgi:hypothetical protein